MSKHTPGPWQINGGRIVAGDMAFTSRETENMVGVVGTIGDQSPQDTANARLVCAAPALLEALRDLVAADNCNYQRDTMRYEGYFDAARRAIEQATGENLWPAGEGSK